jgi:antibiotic biosynthesis monooxygenase (ABM) superfamily enzyme
MSSAPVLPVTLLVTRRVAASRYRDFIAWTEQGRRLATCFTGFLGAGVFAPPAGRDDYQIVFRFADQASLEAWARSRERHAWLQQGTDLVRASQVRYAQGLDNWFGMSLNAPPRWKQAIAIWLAFFPVSLAFNILFGPHLANLPLFWRVLLSTLMLTPVMVFCFIPLSQRLLRRWLQPRSSQPAGLLDG